MPAAPQDPTEEQFLAHGRRIQAAVREFIAAKELFLSTGVTHFLPGAMKKLLRLSVSRLLISSGQLLNNFVVSSSSTIIERLLPIAAFEEHCVLSVSTSTGITLRAPTSKFRRILRRSLSLMLRLKLMKPGHLLRTFRR